MSACALVIGCASSADPPGPSITTMQPPAVDDDVDTSDGPMTTGINPPDDTTGFSDDTTTQGEEDDESTSSTSGDPQESSDGDDSTASDTSGETFLCEAPTTCNSAGNRGGVSGDTTVPSVGETGTEPIWLQVEVSENDSGVLGSEMSVTLDLISVGGDWDIRAYLGDPGDANGCGGLEAASETTGADSIRFEWGEDGALANNADDDAFVAVEIFPKADECTVGSSWSLTVTGNN